MSPKTVLPSSMSSNSLSPSGVPSRSAMPAPTEHINLLTRLPRSGPDGATWVRELGRDATLRLPHGRAGRWLRVERGQVVVTLEGDGADHVLVAGDELFLPGRGLVVAWALEPSRLSGGELRQAHQVRFTAAAA